MNYIGKSTGGSSGGSSRRRQQEGEEEEERQNTGQLFPHPSSSSPPSSHHQNQPSPFHRQPPYHHQNANRGGWVFDGCGGDEPSPRLSESMMVDYLSVPVPLATSDNNRDNDNDNDDNNQEYGGGMMMAVEREHMFDKVVTPSDVGKLNRLVIPKQHAERYFPLDSSTNDKGLLLNFEDRHGKPWRFRYSYWNSSQSYVMTKGWSRFVKDKKLDAGDIVSFQRGVGSSAKDRLFIDWRHRPDAPVPPVPHHQFSFHNRNMNIHPWNPLFLQSQPANLMSHSSLMFQPPLYRYGSTGGPNYNHSIGTGSVVNHVNQGGSGSVIYFKSGGGGGTGTGIGMDPPPPPPPSVVFESVPVVHGKAAAKRLRLFGVNMDCPISDDDDQDYAGPASEYSPTMANSAPISMGNYHNDLFNPRHHQFPPPSSSSSTIPYLQLGPYNHEATMMSSSSTDAYNKSTKSSSSHMSLDLDI